MKTSRLFSLFALTLQLVSLRAGAAAPGTPVWTNSYNGLGNSNDVANAIVVDMSGNVFVAGYSYSNATSNDFATVAYSSAGLPLWTNRYNGPYNGHDYATAIVVDGSGKVFVTGYSQGNGSDNDYATVAYSITGVPLWTNRYDPPDSNNDEAQSIAVDGNGNVFVTGHSFSFNGTNYDYATVAYSGAGVALWTNRYKGPANNYDYAQAVVVDGNGNVFVTGYANGNTTSDYATVAYSNSGTPLWTNLYNGPANGNDQANAIAVDKNGNVFVAGVSGGECVTIKYSATGVPLWTNRYNRLSLDSGNAVAVGLNGSVFVTGTSVGSGSSFDCLIIAYSNAGVPLWTNHYNGIGNSIDSCNAVSEDGHGNIIVTGAARNSSGNSDYVTLAYSVAGVPLWTNLYNGLGNTNDGASALAVDRSGSVFVTGYSAGSGTGNYYVTIKYAGIPPAPLPSGVVSWWRGENNALDSVGPNHGTMFGGAGFEAGQVGQAFSFIGVPHTVSVPTNAAMNFGSGDFAIEFWCRSSVSGVRMQPFTSHKNYGTLNLDFDFNDPDPTTIGGTQAGLWVFWNSSGAKQLTSGAPGAYTDGQWHHIALARADSLMTLYVDGAAVASTNSTEVIDISSDTFIGNTEPGGMVWQGQVDEVTIYSRALTAAEVQSIFTAESAGKAASGAAYLWNGGAGDWFAATNWLPSGVPGSNDTAVIMSGTVDVSANTAVANLTLDAATLQGSGTLTVSGVFNWTGGILQGTGTTVIASGATLSISGDAEKRLGRRLDNFGTATWSGVRITGENGPVINNQPGAIFDTQTDATLYDSYGGNAGTFNNYGTLRKSAGTNINFINGTFTSSGGTMDVQTGTVQPVSSAALTNATFTGPGRFLINGAPTTLDGTVTIAAGAIFEFASGTIIGTNTILGTFNWTGGILGSPGTTTVPTNSVLLITGDNEKRLRRQLDNHGTVTWSGVRITGENGPVFNNQPGAIFDIQTDATLYENYGEILGTFNNSGTFRKSAGTGINYITGTFNNSGRVDVQTGVVQPVGLLNLNTSSLTGAGRLLVNGGTVMLNGTVTVANGTAFEFAAGILGGTGTISGTLNWTGGTMAAPGTTTIATNGVLAISGGIEKRLVRQLDNYGTVTWSGVRITGENGPVFNNQAGALFDVQADATLYESYGGAAGTLNNFGVLRKSASAGTTLVHGTFSNFGVLELRSGVLSLGGSFVPGSLSSVRVFLGGPAAGTNWGRLQIGGAATLGGALNVSLTNGFSPGVNDSFTVVTFGSRSGAFFPVNGVDTGAGVMLLPTYQPTSLTLTAQQSTPRPAGLVAWWRAEENAYDSASTNHGTLQNGATFVTGRAGQAFRFDGQNDVVQITSTGIFKGQSEATIEGWIQPLGPHSNEESFGGQVYGENTSAADWTRFGIYVLNDGRVIGFGRTNESGSSFSVTTTDTVPASQWSHVAATWKTGEGMRVYINGVLKGELTNALGAFSSTSSSFISIGGGGPNAASPKYLFNGDIDEVAVYARALSAAEILALYNAEGGKSVPPGYSYVWNGTTGSWFDTTKWTPAWTPGTNDTAIIGAGSVTVSTNATVSSLTLGGGTLSGTRTLTVTNILQWTGGTLSGAGTLQLAAGGVGGIGDGGTKRMDGGRVLANAGIITWNSTNDINFSGGAQIQNLAGGVFDIQTDADFYYDNAGAYPLITNAGVFRKSAGTNTTVVGSNVGIGFGNSGTVEVQAGTLQFNAAGPGGSSSGVFDVSAGAVLTFGAGFTLNAGASFTGPGPVRWTGSTLTVAGAAAVNGLFELRGGAVTGSGVLTVASGGTMNWTGGTLTGPGTNAVAGGGMLNLADGGTKRIDGGRVLANAGTLIWRGTNDLNLSGSAQIRNLAGGLFDIQTDADFYYDNGGGVPSITNLGVFRKSAGTNITVVGANVGFGFNNLGTLESQTGVLQFNGALNNQSQATAAPGSTLAANGGGTSGGAFAAQAGGLVVFSGGTQTLTNGARLVGTGTNRVSGGIVTLSGSVGAERFQVTGGTVNGTGSLTVTNVFHWTGGTLSGAGTLQLVAGGAGSIGDGGIKRIDSSRILANAGTLIWNSTNDLNISSSAQIQNQIGGVFDIQTDADFYYDNAGGYPSMSNAGTFRKTAGAATTEIGRNVPFTFTNSATGVVLGQAGTLQFNGAFNNNGLAQADGGDLALGGGGAGGGTHRSEGASRVNFTGGAHTLTNAASVVGTGTNRISGGTVAFNGASGGARLELIGGTLGGTGTLTVMNVFHWTGGTLSGAGTLQLAAGGAGGIGDGGTKRIDGGRILASAGTIIWNSADNINISSSAQIQNQIGGVFDIQTDADFYYDNAGGYPSMSNAGVWRKSAGTGTTVVGANVTFDFANTGTVDVRSGTLALTRNYSPGSASTHRFAVGGYGAGTEFGKLQVSGVLTPAGQLDLLLVNSFAPTNGAAFPIITASSRSGAFASVTGRAIGGGLYFTPTYPAAGVTLLVADATPSLGSNSFNLTSGQFQFRVQGIASETYRIDTSTNMSRATNWLPVATNVIPGAGYFDFTNATGTNASHRFFRAVFLP